MEDYRNKDRNIFEDSPFEIMDIDNYTYNKDKVFSYQQIIMRAMVKAVDNGGKEMRSGYWNIKNDRQGNLSKSYIEDTRKAFVESVNTVIMMLECHFDDEAVEKINALVNDVDEQYKEFCEKELNDWNNSSMTIKKIRWNNDIYYSDGCLNEKMPYFQHYMVEEVKIYRKIFSELNQLLKRLKFFEEEAISA